MDIAADRLLALEDKLDEALGDQPFGARKMSADQTLDRWLTGRDDPGFWTDLIRSRQERHGLTVDTVPWDIVKFDKEMQKRLEGRQG